MVKKIVFLSWTVCLLFLAIVLVPVKKTYAAASFGFNVHGLAKDSPENIQSILNYLSQNCQTNIVRFFGFENWGGLDNIQKVLDAAPSGMRFIIALEDFPYGPAEGNPGNWFSSGYRGSFRPYVQRVVSRYANNPKIMVWEIMNEPHCKGDQSCTASLVSFMDDISTLIKSIDPSTLVSPGMMGLGNVGEDFGGGYNTVTALPNITANSCHFYDGNTSGCSTALQITKGQGKYFYVGEAGYKGNNGGSEGSCTSPGCQNLCNDSELLRRASVAQGNLSQLSSAGVDAFIIWQFSPVGSPLLICDKFSIFPRDPICSIRAGLPYVPPIITPPPAQNLNCDPNYIEDTSSRPVACSSTPCLETDQLTRSCATSFQVSDQVSFRRRAGEFCSYEGGKWMVEKSWEGTVVVDPTQIKIPFVGMKGQENEEKYLADYFDGTGFYYKPPYDLTKEEDRQKAYKEGGVWRKLAPIETQNLFKKDMVNRALMTLAQTISDKEGAVHNYIVSYNGETARLSEFTGHFPPTQEEDPTGELYKQWQNTKWGRLWPAVPMFSREDSPGKILPYLGSKVKDKFEIQDADKNTIEYVPHVARLYEVTRAISQNLLPLINAARTTNANTGLIIASEKTNNTPALEVRTKTLLAELPPGNDFHLEASAGYSTPQVAVDVTFVPDGSPGEPGCDGDVNLEVDGAHVGGPNRWNNHGGTISFTFFSGTYIGSPFALMPGSSITKTYTGHLTSETRCPQEYRSVTCTFTVDLTGKFTTNCAGGRPPPLPVCGLPPALPVETCQKDSITSSDPEDTLCCTPININLQAVDVLENPIHEDCEYDPITNVLLNPECMDLVTADQFSHLNVTREIGVRLYHPYLSEIWKYTTDQKEGVFNVLKNAPYPEFKPLDARSSNPINYSYSSSSGTGEIRPSQGEFFFPYLGGIQQAKEWVLMNLNSQK